MTEPDDALDAQPELDPSEAFSLLGDPTRLQIVTTLHERDGPVGFSALYDEVDVDDTGQFNYHQQQLVPHFVEKSDAGYALTAAGRRIARAVSAGTYTEHPQLEPFEMAGSCYACGASALWGAYEDERFEIDCRACGEAVLRVGAPPSLVRGRGPAAFVEAFDRWSRMEVDQLLREICPKCGGSVAGEPIEAAIEEIAADVCARYECAVCGTTAMIAVAAVAASNPSVASFHRERGADLRDRPYWEIEQYLAGEHVEVLSRNPWRIRVSFFAGGDTCHAVIDDTPAVVEVTVVPGGAGSGGPESGDDADGAGRGAEAAGDSEGS